MKKRILSGPEVKELTLQFFSHVRSIFYTPTICFDVLDDMLYACGQGRLICMRLFVLI